VKKIFVVLLLIAFTGTLMLTGCAKENDSENKDLVIKLGNAPYDYEIPVLEVTKQIAEEKGYKVEVVEGDIGFMFMSLAQGDIDAWPGVWLPSIHKSYQEKYSDKYELASAIFENAPIGWVVPKYLDIDSIADLKGNEDIVKGKLIGFEPGSGMMLVSKDIIEGYDLDIELISGTLPSMMAEVDYAIKHDEPILFLGWRPHTMFRDYDIKVLDDPKGFWEYDNYYWGLSKDFKDKSPEMYNFFKNFKMSIEDNEDFLYGYQNEDKDVKVLAKNWIDNNRSLIDTWFEQ